MAGAVIKRKGEINMKNLWKEDASVSSKIRRGLRAAMVWAKEEGPYALVVMMIICGMGCKIIHTLRAELSGPVATRVLSSSHILMTSSAIPGHDPYTIASRADHGHFVSEVGE